MLCENEDSRQIIWAPAFIGRWWLDILFSFCITRKGSTCLVGQKLSSSDITGEIKVFWSQQVFMLLLIEVVKPYMLARALYQLPLIILSKFGVLKKKKRKKERTKIKRSFVITI
jgi:hypothetical protein